MKVILSPISIKIIDGEVYFILSHTRGDVVSFAGCIPYVIAFHFLFDSKITNGTACPPYVQMACTSVPESFGDDGDHSCSLVSGSIFAVLDCNREAAHFDAVSTSPNVLWWSWSAYFVERLRTSNQFRESLLYQYRTGPLLRGLDRRDLTTLISGGSKEYRLDSATRTLFRSTWTVLFNFMGDDGKFPVDRPDFFEAARKVLLVSTQAVHEIWRGVM